MTEYLDFKTFLSISPNKFGIYLFDKNRWKWYNDFELTLMSAAEEANGTRKK